MRLVFPETAEDLGAAFNNALADGVMQREQQGKPTFWARHELVASDVEGDAVIADWFFNNYPNQFLHVSRKG